MEINDFFEAEPEFEPSVNLINVIAKCDDFIKAKIKKENFE